MPPRTSCALKEGPFRHVDCSAGTRTITTSPRQVLSNPLSTHSSPSTIATKAYQCLALAYDSAQLRCPRPSSRRMRAQSYPSLCPGPNAAGLFSLAPVPSSYSPFTGNPRVMLLFLSVQFVSCSSIISAVRQVTWPGFSAMGVQTLVLRGGFAPLPDMQSHFDPVDR
jgi:hypothetical protein